MYAFISYNPLFLFFSYVLELFEILKGTTPYKYKTMMIRYCYFHSCSAGSNGLHETRGDGVVFLSMETFKISRRG